MSSTHGKDENSHISAALERLFQAASDNNRRMRIEQLREEIRQNRYHVPAVEISRCIIESHIEPEDPGSKS